MLFRRRVSRVLSAPNLAFFDFQDTRLEGLECRIGFKTLNAVLNSQY